MQIKDEFASGLPNYKEFWQAITGLAGEGTEFDGNGPYVRLHAGGGSYLTRTPKLPGRVPKQSRLVSNMVLKPRGYKPKKPASKPVQRTDVACYKNTPPDLNGPAAQLGPGDDVVSEGP